MKMKVEKQTYPGRLYHQTPGWVKDGAVFHIRIRCKRDNGRALTHPDLAPAILDAVRLYAQKERWFCHLVLLMPDHLHALLVFPREAAMSQVIGAWKSYLAKRFGLRWQDNYFDHRIRNDAELLEKQAYIRRNPVVKGLCLKEDDWPWILEHQDRWTPVSGRRLEDDRVERPRST
jgi:REP element-mobilizing transposase RayT